jgi:excinuclease ABC subunit C
MTAQMHKLAEQQEFERAQEMKKRIKSLDLLQQEQSFNSSLISVDFFSCISKLDKTGICILSVRDGKIRGTKTHYLKGNQLHDIDRLFQSLIFSYYQNSFSLPMKIILSIKPNDLSLIKEAVKLKFGKQILISANINSNMRKLAKLAKLNAYQVIKNRVNQADKYLLSAKDLASHLALNNKKNLTVEGFDISHHSGKNAVASAVRFSSHGPEKKNYRLFNIPEEFSGNDIGSIRHVLERRINKKGINPLPDIILIDGGKLQLEVALSAFSVLAKKSPMILSIVKGSKRVRSTETILSKSGIVEMPKDSLGFLFLQQIRDESHRFAIASNRKKKNKSIKKSSLNNIKGLGPQKRKDLMHYFKSIQSIKDASVDDLCKVSGISIKLAKDINIFYKS